MADVSVRVALRIRPLVETELQKGCQSCLDTIPGEEQIQVRGTDKAFTFNHVFSPNVSQDEFYNTAVKGMVHHIFQGYNVTILAYGQTGSGKTHSMGTNYTEGSDMGVIPRAVNDIFELMESKRDWEFKVTVSFMELYQEQLYDLLSDKPRSQCIVDIREDLKGIKIPGLTEISVNNTDDTIQCLTRGSLGRATGATAMNAQSSRSHAIFTISVHQQMNDDPNTATMAKFHLVDLAGSERSKKTHATGERFKEGVNINKGLLALGNVISQLGEGSSSNYIGYRDSKLTRLLQDSLGGNSMTLMIACVSPADYNLDETLSTLRYADRARKIKNKPIVNQDPRAAEINRLNKLVQELKLGLLSQGSVPSSLACPAEHRELEEKNQMLQQKNRDLADKLNKNLLEFVHMYERADLAEQAREKIQTYMEEILEEFRVVISYFETSPNETEEHLVRLKSIYEKILDFQNDQKKTAKELINHELSTGTEALPSTDEANDSNKVNISESKDDSESITDFDEKQEEHTMQQAERNSEVQNLNRELALKEELVSKILANTSHLYEYSKELQDMEQEVKSLQAEKEELLQTLHNVQSNKVSSKLAEARRKKVQELEKKISELTRKCTEQSAVIKMKEKSDLKIKNLNSEIQSMKQIKVKLIKQMRCESQRFQQWKLARERELSKLKDQDRKRQNQIVRMESKHSKEQNVMKRKMEEACAINRRLKDALEMQKKAQQRRDKAGNKDGIQAWVSQELEVLVNTVDAERSLERLMQDRAQVTSQLHNLKAMNCDTPSHIKKIADLSADLDLRNAQIADLQQKILDSDQENKARTRWNVIQSMVDAKSALKTLFEIAADMRKKQYSKNYEYDELMDQCDSLRLEVRRQELQQREEANKHRQEIACLHAEHEERVAELLRQLRGASSSSKDEQKIKKNPLKQKVLNIENSPWEASFLETDHSMVEEDDIDKDPDWRKTPLYKRIKGLMDTTETGEVPLAMKRTSDGEVKCKCKTQCSTRLCSCRKNDVSCNNCNCDPAQCKNRHADNMRRTLFHGESDEENSEESFKRPRSQRQSTRNSKKTKLEETIVLNRNSNNEQMQDP